MTAAARRAGAPVRTGPLEFSWDGPGLRHVRWNDAELLAALAVAVRDANWDTVPARIVASSAVTVPGGQGMRWTVRHDDGEVAFRWAGLLRAWSGESGSAELAFELDGVAESAFRANRIGLYLLHPMTLAGQPAQVLGSGGWTAGRFPAIVTPEPLFTGFAGLRHLVAGGATALISLDGGPFEMEDQRNWTDASFKTYSPPLELPFPRQFQPGERVRQAVALRITCPAVASAQASVAGTGSRGHRRRDGTVRVVASGRAGSSGEPNPAASLPAIGIGLAPRIAEVSQADRSLLRALRPSHLHAVVDTERPAWRADLRHALSEAAALGCPADLEMVAASAPEVRQLAAELNEAGRSDAAAAVGRVFVYERSSSQTTRELAAAWPRAAGAGSVRPAGGSRANYAELNRARLPADLLAAVAFAVNPQVHATDDESVMETLAAQAIAARCAVANFGGLPVVVGPVTLRPRFNAVATGPARALPAGSLPPDADPRQGTAFCAAWLAGSITALAPSGAAALTYFETAGIRGLLAGRSGLPPGFPRPGTVYPVYHVLALLAPLAGRPLIAVSCDDPGSVAALAIAGRRGPLVMLANLRPATTAVLLGSELTGTAVYRLPSRPEAAVLAPGRRPLRPGTRLRAHDRGGDLAITLSPWEVVAVGAGLTEAAP